MNRTFWQRFAATALGVLAGVVAAAGTLAVAVAGFTLSYDAIRKVGIASGIRQDWAWLLPVSVDGAMAVATVTAVVLRRMGRPVWYPWAVVLAGSGISIACNALHAKMRDHIDLDNETAMAVSAIPAVMLALSVHLLVVLVEAAAQTFSEPGKGSATNISAERVGDQTDQVAAPDQNSATVLIPTAGTPTGQVGDQTDSGHPLVDPDRDDLFADLMPPDPWVHATSIGTDPTDDPTDDPASDHASDLRTRDDQTGDQTDDRPMPALRPEDIDLVAKYRDRLLSERPLTRYRVEQVTGASRRQAQRILNHLTGADQITDQTTDLVAIK